MAIVLCLHSAGFYQYRNTLETNEILAQCPGRGQMCACSGNVSQRVASAHLALFAAEPGESDWQLPKLTLHG